MQTVNGYNSTLSKRKGINWKYKRLSFRSETVSFMYDRVSFRPDSVSFECHSGPIQWQ